MEEFTVRAVLLGEQLTLTAHHFLTLQPLLSSSTLQSIRLPLRLSRFSIAPDILDACLYYLIAMDHEVAAFLGREFREGCLERVGMHYMNRKMHFQLYEYSYVCCHMLGMPLNKVIHMLYFMIYARLAARPFVRNLIAQAERHPRANKPTKTHLTTDQDIASTTPHHTNNSRHMTVFCDTPNYETQAFQKELKATLRPNKTTKKPNPRTENCLFVNVKQQDIDSDPENSEEGANESAQYRVGGVPVKPSIREVSSILAHFKSRTGTQLPTWSGKALTRRQKFNEYYDGFERLNTAMETYSQKENRCYELSFRPTQREISHNRHPKNLGNKRSKDFFNKITASLKSQNVELDQMRGECVKDRQLKRHKRGGDSAPKQQYPLLPFKPLENELQSVRYLVDSVSSYAPVCRRVPVHIKPGSPKEISHHITRKTDGVTSSSSVLPFRHRSKKIVKTQQYKAEKKNFVEKKLFEKLQEIC